MNSARPHLPMWIFIATDLALLGAAAVIAAQAPRPFSEATILWIVGCVTAGIFLGLVPIIWRFERQKNEALDDRQRALEALARTISSSADQISIATGGLHEIVELAQKNLRHADHLPQKLQEKIAEFQAQLAQANDTDKEELERELLALRTSESERLDSVSQRIAKASAEWAKLESATALHLTTASETLAKLSLGTASAIGQAQAAAEQALAQARIEAARNVGEASGQALKALESARTAALADLTAKLTGLTHRLADDVAALIVARIATSTTALGERRSDPEPAAPPPAVVVPSTPLAMPASAHVESTKSTVSGTTTGVAATQPNASPPTAAQSEGQAAHSNHSSPGTPPAQPPAAVANEQTSPVPVTKRPRKPRSEAPPIATSAEAAAAPAGSATSGAVVSPSPEFQGPAAGSATNPAPPAITGEASAADAAATPSPIPEPIPTPFLGSLPAPVSIPSAAKPVAIARATTSEPPVVAPVSDDPDAVKSAPGLRKRAARKAADDDPPALDLGLDDTDFGDTARNGRTERVMTSDGATRLLITAYIGIGNRLFIRGDGPGLNWEKGVPLSFISIGKWRWETNDAVQPISFKLYKNDELECSALGTRTLDPGYQQEVTAAF